MSDRALRGTFIGLVTAGAIAGFSVSASAGSWVNATGNLAGMGSECGNLYMVQAYPNSNKIIAGVSAVGLFATTNGGTTWTKMGSSGSTAVTNRASQIIFDPSDPNTFWECGIYHAPGVVKSTDGGASFIGLGGIYHNDGMSVDLSDPQRLTILAGAHETKQKLYKSVDGGNSFVDIGANLPGGTGFSSYPYIVSKQVYVMTTTAGWGGGSNGIFRSTDAGTTWSQVSSEGPSSCYIVTSKGSVFFGRNGGGLLKGTLDGTSWSVVNCGAIGMHPVIELPDGRLAILTSSNISISADNGATWQVAIPSLPYSDGSGLTYNSVTGAFYICHWDCGGVVLSDAIQRYDTMMQAGLNIYALSASPTLVTNDKATAVTFSVHASTSSGTISSVTIDLSSIGGGANVAMTQGAGDLYSTSFTVAAGLAVGTKSVTATATDNTGASKTQTTGITIATPAGPLHYQYLYVDTSVLQTNFGWYGNGNGNNAAATGCSAVQDSTGNVAYEGTKCLDFGFTIAGWWAGFGLVWNNYNYKINANGWDTLVFYFKADGSVQMKVNLDCGTAGTPTGGATMMLGGTGGWARATLPFDFFKTAGYNTDSVQGINFVVQGTSASTPGPGHVLIDDMFLVGSGTVSVANTLRPAGSRMPIAAAAVAAFDLNGRIVDHTMLRAGISSQAGRLYLVRMSDGTVAKRLVMSR